MDHVVGQKDYLLPSQNGFHGIVNQLLGPGPVSYTHLDVYKRQADVICQLTQLIFGPVPKGNIQTAVGYGI